MKRLILILSAMALAAAVPSMADTKGSRSSVGVIIDTGNGSEGYAISVPTTTVAGGTSGITAGKIFRLRSYQNTSTTYDILATTYTPVPAASWATAPGWIVKQATGSWSTSSQDAFYFTLDPAAGAGTAIMKGRGEFQRGEVPKP